MSDSAQDGSARCSTPSSSSTGPARCWCPPSSARSSSRWCWCGWRPWRWPVNPKTSGLRFGIAFAAFAVLTLFAIYNLSWIFSTLSGRLVLFVPLILVCLTYLAAFPAWPRLATAALGVLIVASIYWTASWSARQFTADLAALGFPENFVPPAAYLSRDYRAGPPVPGPRGLLIAPSPFEEPRGLRN